MLTKSGIPSPNGCLSKIPRFYAERINVQIWDVDVLYLPDWYAWVGTTRVPRFIAAAGGEGESLVAAADAIQKAGLIDQVLGDNVGNAARALDAAAAGHHLRTQDGAA